MENDARSLDQKTQAELRRRAHILHKQGKSRQEIADALGVHLKTIDRWRADFRRDGAVALRPKKRGRKEGCERTLTSEQEKEIQNKITEKTPDHADILIYEGTTTQVTSGGGHVYRAKFPIFTLIDTDNAIGYSIPYYNRGGQKTYQRGNPNPVVKADLSLGKGKSAIVIMWPINRQAEDPANVAESLVITGRNAVINTGKGTLNFPPVLDYTSTSIAWDGDTAQHLHFTFKSRLLLNRSLTQQSNKIGESLDQVADRIAAALEARGYSFEGG